jgi:hypothetical protein
MGHRDGDEGLTALLKFKGSPSALDRAERRHLVADSYSFSHSLDGRALQEFPNLRMEEATSTNTLVQDHPVSSTLFSGDLEGRLAKDTNHQPDQPPLSVEITTHIKLQEELTLLRVQLQQLRTACARARKDVVKQESRFEQALRRSKMTGIQLDFNDYQEYLASMETARNILGPAEQEVEDTEFRLVNEEARLARQSRRVRLLLSRHNNSQHLSPGVSSLPLPPAPFPDQEHGQSPRASTVFYFQNDSAEEQPEIFDPDASNGSEDLEPYSPNLSVDHFAPDLDNESAWFRPGSPEAPELYVSSRSELLGSSANCEEYMEFNIVDYPAKKLFLSQQLLETFFTRWTMQFRLRILQFHDFRTSTLDMVRSHSTGPEPFSISQRSTEEIDEGWINITYTNPLQAPADESPESRDTSQARVPSVNTV